MIFFFNFGMNNELDTFCKIPPHTSSSLERLLITATLNTEIEACVIDSYIITVIGASLATLHTFICCLSESYLIFSPTLCTD